MRRGILYLVGAGPLLEPAILGQITPRGILGSVDWASLPGDLPIWLRVSVFAGANLIQWGPVLVGLLIIYYANRKQR